MPAHPNAHANDKKWICGVQYQGNWFEFGIIGNDFYSSTISAISFAVFKNPKIPGIQPINISFQIEIAFESLS